MMRVTAVRRALLLAVVILLLLCCAYIAAESGHHCPGEGCPVCAQIHFCMDVLMSLAAVIMVGGFASVVVRLRMDRETEPVCAVLTAATPVMMKVRQNR
jgi:hypothetical protein